MSGKARISGVIFAIGSTLLLGSCGGGNSQPDKSSTTLQQSNPVPFIGAVSPGSATAGSQAFTMSVTGTNFVAASIVNFAGTARATTFVSATQLTAAIPASAIASASTATVTVTNPAPGGGTSNAMNFSINSTIPVIDLLSPSCGPKGQPSLNPFLSGQLLVDGKNFVANSVVRWNGSDRPTTFLSSNQLTAQISANDIATVGTASVTVFNPAPGQGSSEISTFTITPGGVLPLSIAVDPTGKFAYVANEGCGDSSFGNVSMYTIDSSSGALASVGPPVPSNDEIAASVTADPTGKFVYVANSGAGDTVGSVSAYTISGTGALTFTAMAQAPCAASPAPGSCSPSAIAVVPSGKFVYVANEGGFTPTSLSMYTVDATTGTLTLIGTVATNDRATSVAVDPSGKFVYATNSSDIAGSSGSVSMYTINGSTGALTSIGHIAAGINPFSIAIDPLARFAYVTNSGSNISIYSTNSTTGALTSMGTLPESGPLAFDPSGKFAYRIGPGDSVSAYAVNATTGVLTLISTIGAGSSPSSIVVHPSGKFVYVTNAGSNNVSMYSLDATTGNLTLIGSVGT